MVLSHIVTMCVHIFPFLVQITAQFHCTHKQLFMEQQDLWTQTQSRTDPAAKHIMVLHK